MSDFRVKSFREAQKCLRFVSKQSIEQPEFWANLIGAAANAAVASVSDSVYREIVAEDQHLAREHTIEKLTGVK